MLSSVCDLPFRGVGTYPFVCLCVHAHACVWRLENSLECRLQQPSTCFVLRQGLSLAWAVRLAGQWSPGIHLSIIPELGKHVPAHQLFTWARFTWTRPHACIARLLLIEPSPQTLSKCPYNVWMNRKCISPLRQESSDPTLFWDHKAILPNCLLPVSTLRCLSVWHWLS